MGKNLALMAASDAGPSPPGMLHRVAAKGLPPLGVLTTCGMAKNIIVPVVKPYGFDYACNHIDKSVVTAAVCQGLFHHSGFFTRFMPSFKMIRKP